MGIFDNYQNINAKDIPNNTVSDPSEDRRCLSPELPRHIYNVKGSFVGYGWSYGDTFDMLFSVATTIKVREDSIIYNEIGMQPTNSTAGKSGQQAYNTVDVLSWTCVGVSNGYYIWVQDDCVSYPDDGTLELTFNSCDDTSVQFDVYNFRWEPIHTLSNLSSATISFSVDKDISLKFKPGIYYGILKQLVGESQRVYQKVMFVVD